jgi:hypothetical protein
MLLDEPVANVVSDLFSDLDYPFNPPYEKYPRVPCMTEICEWMWEKSFGMLMPFERCPKVAISPRTASVSVWAELGEHRFQKHMRYGPGLLEGKTDRAGHMCAWDGKYVYDPRGYIYEWHYRTEHEFDAERFWLYT